jgi:hypothetical protein
MPSETYDLLSSYTPVLEVSNHNTAEINEWVRIIVKALDFKARFPRWLFPVADNGTLGLASMNQG